MMPWFKKKPPVHVPSDVGEAREMRADAQEEYRTARLRADAVRQLTAELVERRALNHFGESIQITFTRRAT